MAFTDIFFLMRFLPVFLIVYYLAPNKYKDAILFIGSIVFYGYGDRRMVFLLLGLTIVNHFLGKALVKPRGISIIENGSGVGYEKISILPAVKRN